MARTAIQSPPTLSPPQVLLCGAAVATVSMGIRHGFGLWLQPATIDRGWSREAFAFALGIQNLSWGCSVRTPGWSPTASAPAPPAVWGSGCRRSRPRLVPRRLVRRPAVRAEQRLHSRLGSRPRSARGGVDMKHRLGRIIGWAPALFALTAGSRPT
jgi:hypothetical protein